ncbi:MAG: hypothetical protein Q9Q40_12745, partial [Acidobacteriota bacterium]|nr:hypothetical protein [Acidobacteriota bacterium]
DLDGDGVDDLVVGVHNYYGSAGAVVVFRGPVVGDHLDLDADVVWDNGGEETYNELGESVESVGDATGDGLPDVLVGDWGGDSAWLVQGETVLRDMDLDADAQVRFRGDTDLSNGLGRVVEDVGDLDLDGWPDVFASGGGSDPSDAYVFLGPFDVPGTRHASMADIHLEGDEDADYYPWAAGPGDVTGDGGPDLLVCSDQYDNRHGALYIVEGTGW